MAKIRVRARAVDMLGRQQVTGVPTAIHELFKNAHDAYAEQVVADFLRKHQMLVLRDNGVGMTSEEFETKWLTLGTESKLTAARSSNYKPPSAKERAITGEKGIGRLAIATVGRQVLILTRAIRHDGVRKTVASLIHWQLFELPGIDLDEIDIPVITGAPIDRKLLAKLADRVRQNLASLGEKLDQETRASIESDLNLLRFDPMLLTERLGGPSLSGNGHGTHFFVTPVEPMLATDLTGSSDDSASDLQKNLLGFSNTMSDDCRMETAFRDHRLDGTTEDLISDTEFFSPDELNSGDHYIEGHFDPYGQFSGSVSVYRNSPKDHVLNWGGAHGKKTLCGPFSIRFGYLQGNRGESDLPHDQWANLSSKLNRVGGLYIYRDGIRVLPYGNAEYDFLDIEKRRSKRASEGFFSYRRMFGYIELTRGENSELIEKAGREGFRGNQAYNQFRDILMSFLWRTVMDFFREDTAIHDDYLTRKNELQLQNEALKARGKAVAQKKIKLRSELDRFFEAVETAEPEKEATMILERLNADLEDIVALDEVAASTYLLRLESNLQEKVNFLRKKFSVAKPTGVSLSKAARLDLEASKRSQKRLDDEVWSPLAKSIDSSISAKISEANLDLDRRRRTAGAINNLTAKAEIRKNQLSDEVNEQLGLFEKEFKQSLTDRVASLHNTITTVRAQFDSYDISEVDEDDLLAQQLIWEGEMQSALVDTETHLESLRAQLADITEDLHRRNSLGGDILAAVESKSESYREQLDQYFEFAQVGMSLGIIQHEFASTIKRIRDCIRKLKPWAIGTPELEPVYKDIRSNFEHLDGYLSLFTPLHRRLYRKAIQLTGREIRRYLFDVFEERLSRHGVDFEFAGGFDTAKVTIFPSTLLPVFVSLIDNAIHWLVLSSETQRIIKLEKVADGFSVSNNGPPIETRFEESIFEFGVSTKTGGRGMGLYISREALRREGHDLLLVRNSPPCFLIQLKNDADRET